MPDSAKLAVFHGTGKPFEIREYPVPEPGAILATDALRPALSFVPAASCPTLRFTA